MKRTGKQEILIIFSRLKRKRKKSVWKHGEVMAIKAKKKKEEEEKERKERKPQTWANKYNGE